MKAEIYWIQTPSNGRLGTMPKPRGGDWLDTEIQALRQIGVDNIVSLLTYPENVELGLTKEATLCQAYGLDFISFPIQDRNVPESKIDTGKLIRELVTLLDEGKSIAVHCRAGIGRASLIAASILTTYNIPAEEAFSIIEKRRGLSVPDTQEQKDWVSSFETVFSLLN
jgi:protein-tyrosine phosphatase